MFRDILTILLIVSLTVSLLAIPTNETKKHVKDGVLEKDSSTPRSMDSQRHEISKNNKTSHLVVNDYIDDKISKKEDGNDESDDISIGHILKTDEDDEDLDGRDTLVGKGSDIFSSLLIHFNDITEALSNIGHSLADGAHVAAGKISDISHKTHDVYLVSKDHFLKTEEKIANKAHDIFLYTQEEFDYVVDEMRKEVNRHALYIGLLSGICSYFLMFPITFLLSLMYRKCCSRRNRLPFFCKKYRGENKPLLNNEKGVGAVDFDL